MRVITLSLLNLDLEVIMTYTFILNPMKLLRGFKKAKTSRVYITKEKQEETLILVKSISILIFVFLDLTW